jgi:hypothetical protein
MVLNIPSESISAYVVVRCLLRIALLCTIAAFGAQGFAKMLEALLLLTAVYCIFAAALRAQAPLGPVLTHIDEVAAHMVCARLASWVS